jgi:hypothetical protein
VGESALSAAAKDPWIERQLQQDVSLYAQAYQENPSGGGVMPQILVGGTVCLGPPTRDALFQILESHLGLKIVNP